MLIKGVAALVVGSLASSALAGPFELPRVDNVKIDGDAADWGERGLRVDYLSNPNGRLFPRADLAATCRLGYDDAGLVVLVDVRDDVHDESSEERTIDAFDSVELYVSGGVGAANRYRYTVTTGSPTTRPRAVADDRRPDRATLPALASEFACVEVEAGRHRIEMRLPWANLGGSPMRAGGELGFNVRVNDTDRGLRKSITWLPKLDGRTNADSVQPLVLVDAPTTRPVRALVQGGFDDALAWTNLTISAVPELAGLSVEVVRGGKTVRTARLEVEPTPDPKKPPASIEARATTRLPIFARGESSGDLAVVIDGTAYPVTIRPTIEETRAIRVAYLPLALSQTLLESATIPSVDFENPLLAQQALGNYDVKVTAYDADYNLVTAATKPGRYGLVIDFVPEGGGPAMRRYRTIWRAPDGWDFYATLPRTGESALDNWLEVAAERDRSRDGAWPALLAAGGPTTRPTRVNADALTVDRQWWVGLKRKLNGWDKQFADAKYVCPRPIDGAPAPTLRAGTPAEAGMTDDGVRALDALLREWADKGGQPFGALIARDGVAVIDAAYGTRRDGTPATPDDRYWAASVTKFIAATAMMTLVDQKLIDLDAPIEQYLPAFAKARPAGPSITLRHCYTHTTGVPLRGGDSMNDLDEVLGGLYPWLRVGQRYEYTGVGLALGGKVVEAVTGEALPALYLKHFLEPLGMTRTDVRGSSGDASLTARDLATFGQMMLNGGAYGPHRFLSAESVEAMKSQTLTKTLGANATDRRGIGTDEYPTSPLGKGTFGHGAASSTLFRVSPDSRVVLVIARDAAGKEYDAYAARVQKATAEAIAK